MLKQILQFGIKKFWLTALFMVLGVVSIIVGIATASIAEKWSYLGFGVLGFIAFYIFAVIAQFVTLLRLGKEQNIKMPSQEEEKN